MKYSRLILLAAAMGFAGLTALAQKSHEPVDSLEMKAKQHYTKREVMIPMRDGVKLYTAIYEPKDNGERHPILMMRTPYSCAPYGDGFNRSVKDFDGSMKQYLMHNYILVFQDIRGRHHSEGEFVQVRPLHPDRMMGKAIDESTDTYDTIEWLIHNTHSNQRVGTWGISYDGFQATMTAASNHPALKAVSPQGPVTDWFLGDDRHHNGAFTFLQTTNFLPWLEGRHQGEGVMDSIVKHDVYTDFLALGTFRDADLLVNDTTETLWNSIREHPHYDSFWQARDARKACYNIRPAVLVTGGLFDSEDCYGAWHTYKAIKTQSPETELYLAFGPWWHGAWTRRSFEGFGNIYFGESTSAYYKDHIEYPFFRYYLEGKGEKPSHRVSVFHTGANRWEFMDEWPAPSVFPTPFYLHEGGKVSTMAPTETSSYSEYISDMEHPVPFTANPVTYRTLEFMVDDQRFASSRPDVLTFVSPILEDTLTLAGPIEVQLQTAISSTDADFMVKVIDVFPANYKYPEEATSYLKNSHYPMGGYQLMVRGELFRGRYRESFEYPKAFVPNERTEVSYTLPDVAHVFLPGHRLMIQVQSSWFPIIDRNPQRFIDTYTCTTEDFEMQQRIRIYHQADAPSRVILPVVKQ